MIQVTAAIDAVVYQDHDELRDEVDLHLVPHYVFPEVATSEEADRGRLPAARSAGADDDINRGRLPAARLTSLSTLASDLTDPMAHPSRLSEVVFPAEMVTLYPHLDILSWPDPIRDILVQVQMEYAKYEKGTKYGDGAYLSQRLHECNHPSDVLGAHRQSQARNVRCHHRRFHD